MKIKIINADPWNWYSNNIGKVYEVKCRDINNLSVDIAKKNDICPRIVQYGHYIIIN